MSSKEIEVMDALYTIQDYCKEHNDCEKCPICKEGNCIVSGFSPDQWDIDENGRLIDVKI